VIVRDPSLLDQARDDAKRIAAEGRGEEILNGLRGAWRTRLGLPAIG
jgi:hypothetical protein